MIVSSLSALINYRVKRQMERTRMISTKSGDSRCSRTTAADKKRVVTSDESRILNGMMHTISGDGAPIDERRASMNDGSGYNEKLNQSGASSDSSLTSGYRSACLLISRGPRNQRNKSVSDRPAVDDWRQILSPRDQYNKEDFRTNYDNAKFYVIKSIGEDDIHKSIKYSVWSCTNHGNGKLNDVFCKTQQDTSEVDPVCPIFLFFAVNRGGQFVGVAEMIGRVDFVKTLDFWQSKNWNGFFPVRWHIIKDVPNTQLSHIIVERINRPVTHTRDLQEIGLQQGLEMLRIFKNYTAMTSMLDDINFYDKRERSIRLGRDEEQ
ncbi:YTH domain-containing protein ECT3-like isoform X1 [Apium graveolens]|uniref:YTH domain-containing protein ECT3-like isoform X1 n=2 Tax=Apium graveolens TaxID=4045 RepID=UPI003D7ABEFE